MISRDIIRRYESGQADEPTFTRSSCGSGLEGIVTVEAIDRLIAVVGLREPFFAMSNTASGIVPFNTWHFHDFHAFCAVPSMVLREVLTLGTTLIIKHAQTAIPSIRALVASIEALAPGLKVQANCYLTPPGSSGVAPHSDPRDTILVQQLGTKRWKIWPRDEAHSELGTAPVRKPILDVTLHPGDTLRIPAGFIHCSSTEEQFSLHVTFGIMKSTAVQLGVSTQTSAMSGKPALCEIVKVF